MASSRRPATNESISSFGSAVGRDYSDLATWEVATQIDCVAGQVSPVLECYRDSASYSQSVVIDGAPANATYHRIIRAAAGARHNGIPGTGIHFTSAGSVIVVSEAYAEVWDIECTITANSTSTVYAFSGFGVPIERRFIGCIASNCMNTGTGLAHGFGLVGDFMYATNCLAYNCESIGFTMQGTPIQPCYFYNCTAVGNGVYGFRVNTNLQAVYKNCLASGNTSKDFENAGITTGSTNNASSDINAPGTTARISQTFTFVNAAARNYHLATGDAGALGFGADLSADAVFPFNDDIDGETITVWSIGMDAHGVFPVTPISVPIVVVAPTLSASVTITPTAISASVIIPDVILIAESAIAPDAILVPFSIAAPMLSASVAIAPTAISVSITIPDVTLIANSTIAPDTILVPFSVAAPTLSASVAIVSTPILIPILMPSQALSIGGMVVTPSLFEVSLLLPIPILFEGLVPSGGILYDMVEIVTFVSYDSIDVVQAF